MVYIPIPIEHMFAVFLQKCFEQLCEIVARLARQGVIQYH